MFDAKIGKIQGKVIKSEGYDIVLGMLQSISMRDYEDDVFKDFGTDNQMSGYLERLSDLIGEDIGMLENKNIKFRNKELDIKEAQDFIFDFVKGLY